MSFESVDGDSVVFEQPPTTPVKHRVIVDEGLIQMYSALRTAVDALKIDGEAHPEIAMPTLVVTGTQSAGKTTFIETLLGFQVGPIAKGTGTRCPVRYMLQRSTDGSSVYKVDGRPCANRRQVRQKVAEKMQKIANKPGSGFSNDPIKVEVQEPGLMDMDITDLPGLKIESEDDFADINNIVQTYLQKPDVIPVVLTSAQDSPQTQQDIKPLIDLGLNLPESIIIVNRVNDKFRSFFNMKEINAYFQAYKDCNNFKDSRAVCLVMLHPTLGNGKGLNVELMSADDTEQFYSTLPEEELLALQTWCDNSVTEGNFSDLHSEARSMFGVKNAHQGLLEALVTWTRQHGEMTVQHISQKINPLEGRIRELKSDIKERERRIEMCEMNMHQYYKKFISVLGQIRAGNRVYLEQAQNEAEGIEFAQVLVPHGEETLPVASTYFEEVNLLPPKIALQKDDQFGVWKGNRHLSEALGSRHTGELLSLPLTCHAAIHRLLKVSAYQVMIRPMREYTRAQIESKLPADGSGLINTAFIGAVVMDCVRDNIFEIFSEVFPRLLEHVRVLCERPLDKAHEALEHRYPDIAYLQDYKHELDLSFQNWLDLTLKTCRRHLNAMLKEKTSTFPVDIDAKLVHLLCLAPQDLNDSDLTRPISVPSPVPSHDNLEEEFPHADTGLFPNTVSNQIPLAPDDDPHKASREAFRESRKMLYSHSINVDPLDFVEGGHTNVTSGEFREVHLAVNANARKLFHYMKGMLLLELDQKILLYLRDVLTGDDSAMGGLFMHMEKDVERYMSGGEPVHGESGGDSAAFGGDSAAFVDEEDEGKIQAVDEKTFLHFKKILMEQSGTEHLTRELGVKTYKVKKIKECLQQLKMGIRASRSMF